jgi:3-oxoacyl-[acyl-carrier-protein] synthase II
MTSGREVVISGLGAVSAFGRGAEVFWRGVLSGATAIREGRFGWAASCEVDALAAAREAIADAGLGDLARVALVCGTTTGGVPAWLGGATDAQIAYHAPAGALARALGIGGPVVVPSVACASGTAAIGLALDLVRSGRADAALCGGADVLTDFVARGFGALQAVDTRGPCRPFDRERAGLSLGEGAAFLVVQRNARRARAILRGAGLAGDAVHMTAPDREGGGAARAMSAALADGAMAPSDIEFVSAHGTGTAFNDAMESRALVRAGLSHAAVHGVKGAIGHTLAAAGAFEALLCVRVLETGELPPTTGMREKDPAIELDVIAQPRRNRVRAALSTSSGFGGMNASILLTKE